MIGGGDGPRVFDLVQRWTPSQVHDHENKYQSELQEFLDEQLNRSGGGIDLGMGGSESFTVSTERGTAYGDVVVNDRVGIELKRNFSNDQKRKLRGQLEDYADNYESVIACGCGIDDTDGWREVEQKFSRRGGLIEGTEFRFIIKRREEFGSRGRDGDGGFLGGGGLFR